MIGVEVAALAFVRRHPTPRAFLATVSAGILVTITSGLCLGSFDYGTSYFVSLGMIASGIFIHGLIVMVGGWYLLRNEHKVAARISLGCALTLVWIAVQAFAIEPTWLEVTTYRVETDKLTRPVKIAVIADIQTDHIGAYERRAISQAVNAKPDLILWPGDFVQHSDLNVNRELRLRLNSLLRDAGMSAPLGVHAVRGNSEMSGWPEIFAGLDAELYESSHAVERGELSITGLSFFDTFETGLEVDRPTDERFHLVFGHAPDFALGDVDADLMIAGHTHGGQVQLPFLGPLLTLSAVSREWASDRTDLDDGRTLIVSRGVGLEREGAPRLRFLCRPQLVFIELVPAPQSTARQDG